MVQVTSHFRNRFVTGEELSLAVGADVRLPSRPAPPRHRAPPFHPPHSLAIADPAFTPRTPSRTCTFPRAPPHSSLPTPHSPPHHNLFPPLFQNSRVCTVIRELDDAEEAALHNSPAFRSDESGGPYYEIILGDGARARLGLFD